MTEPLPQLSQMRCAVLGAGGFLGTNLCQGLKPRVASLRAFGRRLSFPSALTDIEWIPGDFSQPTSVATAISGCDTVFHLVNATTPASANIDKLADLQSNVTPTLRLLEACREAGVKRVIFISSGGTIYGLPKQVPTPESAPTDPITAYGISKLAIEKYLGLYEYLHGLQYRVLRVANPFGPYQTALKSQGVIAAFMHQCISHEPIHIWGDGSSVRDYVYVNDVVDAVLAAVQHHGPSRVFNIGGGQGRSLLDIVDVIKRVSGITPEIKFSPSRSVDVPRSILDITLASQELGWTPKTAFDEGMQRTWAWAIAQHQDGTLY
ncbi:NAD-dependent epimerase/dehydratase family protein [Achromobacter sp. B7]|uniref:NAD-dependent epimerase/dehydratase family protein n=1 Tax=Achromobacter sp. B7 TaxID=2282475 RepID=UPI0013C4284A|nr:NAD-dependent epimerase/dehydratase family protein [Achromobacter sp. B7]